MRDPRRRPGAALPALLLLAAALLPPPGSVLADGQDVADEVFYHFMPICWRDSDGDSYRYGDFGGMTASLDYLQALGVTACWMNPPFPSPAYHGYQHGAADGVEPRLGTSAGLVAFVEAAHARGIKVFVDFVAYGISHDSPWFQDAYRNSASPYDDWLAFTNSRNTEYQGSLYTTWNGDTVGFIHWDLRSAGPVDLVTQWARHWLDPDGDGLFADGLDGYRLDHVWVTYPNGPDGWGYHLDSFWTPWRQALRDVNPQVFVFAEQADWGSHGAELLAGFDAAFTKPFEFAARDALRYGNAGSLYSQMDATLAALSGAPAVGTFLATIGNHDVDRLATSIGDEPARGKAAAAVLLLQPFPPVVYHGDEIGMRGAKNTGYAGDAADLPMREPFKWTAVAGPPMSDYDRAYAERDPAYARASADHDGRSVQEQLDQPGSLLEAYRQLIAARRASVALRRGGYTAVTTSSPAVWAFVRDHAEQQVLVAINLQGSATTATLDLSRFAIPGGSTVPLDLLGGPSLPALTEANRGAYPLPLGPFGYKALQVAVVPPEPPTPLVDGRDVPADLGGYALATQDTPTGFGDNVCELDQLFVKGTGDALLVGITGNLATDGTGLALLLDTRPGGQNVLDLSGISAPPSGPPALTGTVLDAGFAPDHLLFVNAWSGSVYVDQIELLDGGGASKIYRGQGTVGDGDGWLLGGANAEGMQVALDNGNLAGVTAVSAAGAATAARGFEMYLPLASFGVAPGQVAQVLVAAFVLRTDGTIGNQWLPGLGGAPELGLHPDLTAVPGLQYAAALVPTGVGGDPGAGPARAGEEGPYRLVVSAGGPGEAPVELAFELAAPESLRLEVLDLRGRRVVTLLDGPQPAGSRRLVWDGRDAAGRPVPAGVYLCRLAGAVGAQTKRAVVVR